MGKVTLKMLEVYLRRFGWTRYEIRGEEGEKEGLIHALWGRPGGKTHALVIDPIVEKGVLIFHVPKILSAPFEDTSSQCLLELLIALGRINYQILLGKFSYDPNDGEVRFSITMPIDKNTVTYEQFEHCMNVLIQTVEKYNTILGQIARGEKTHRDIGSGEGEILMMVLRRLLSDLSD